MKKKCLLLGFLSVFFVQSSQDIPKSSSTPTQLVKHVIKKTFPQDYYKIDRIPVESGIYLQQMIVSYNANMKHAIVNWLKKESENNVSYAKELSYLLGQLDSIVTPKQSIVILTRALSAYHDMRKTLSVYQEESWQERAFVMILLQCCVVLVNVAREQLLMILDEINSALIYWRDQKQAPIKYFFGKSPLKWVTGKRQADEIAGNIRKLEKLEHDIRVVLGRLTKHIYEFNMTGDNSASYAWVDSLLSILVSLGTTQEDANYNTRFEKIAEKLRFKLGKVGSFKDTILSKISSARKPGHITRNWLRYSAALAAAYLARNYYLKNQDFVNELVGPQALFGYAEQAQEYTKENVIKPLVDTAKAIFVGRTTVSPDQEKIGQINRDTLKKTLKELSTPIKPWNPFGQPYGVVEGKPLSETEMNYILDEESKGNLDPLLELLIKIDAGITDISVRNTVKPLISIILQYATLSVAQGKKVAQENLRIVQEQFRVVWNLILLFPGIFFTGLGIAGLSKLYQSTTARDYTSIRLKLLDINSVFIESEAPLSDHDYGKLIYLLQGLKLEVSKYLTEDDMRDDFLHDLAKLESNKFDVKQKRGIIKNMFMKYPFLGLNTKSA